MDEANLPQPIFQKVGIFTVTLYRPAAVFVETTKKSREKILSLIQFNPEITMGELAESIGISVKAIEKQIALLKRENRIERIGPDKGGYWKINESNL